MYYSYLTAFLMQASGWDSSFLNVISRSSAVSKGVLVVLLFFSIVSWAIIAEKYFSYRRARYQNGQFYRLFKKAASLSDLANAALRYRNSPFARMYLIVYNDTIQPTRGEPGAKTAATLAPGHVSQKMIDRAITRSGLSETAKLESTLGFLATTASATPFIGLFGTVWGIINAFESIAGARSTDLSIVAPGIAEALIATAMGLAAAIPAVIGYNYLTNQVRSFGSEMEEFSLELLTFLERQQVMK